MNTPNMDGPTATQVSPVPTEGEMNMFRQILDRAFNAIAQGSELAKQVEALQAKISEATKQIEQVMANNRWLDENLATTRKQRDEAIADCGELRSKLAVSDTNVRNLSVENEHNQNSLKRILDELDHAKHDRDDAAYRNLELQDALDKANAKLAEIAKFFGQASEPVKPAESNTQMIGADPNANRVELPKVDPMFEPDTPSRQWWEKDDAAPANPAPTYNPNDPMKF